MDIVLSLVFSSVLLIFMIYPSMKIADFVETKIELSDKVHDILTVILTVILSLIIGFGLYYI